jgi:uncharacterized membrane protein YqjE
MSDYVGEPADPRSLRDLVGGVADDAQNLVRGEIALARVEIGQKLSHAIVGLIWVVVGLLFAFSALVILMIAVAAALTLVVPAWAASLIVAVIALVIGAIAARTGLAMLSIDSLMPTRTTNSVAKDAQMVKEHVS